jgi:Protein of unknown function (DUF3489)
MSTATTTAKKKSTKKKAIKKVATKKAAPKAAKPTTTEVPAAAKPTRKGTIVTLIERKGGATLTEIMEATGWQAHSVRGTLSTLGKTMKIESAKNEDGARTYSAA